MSLELIGKYIGPDEIISTESTGYTTPSGKSFINVCFKTGRSHPYTEETLSYIVTDEPSDPTSVLEKKMTPIVRKVMDVLYEYDVNSGEIEMLFKQIGFNIDVVFDKATSWLWFKNHKEHVPGFDPMMYVSLMMAKTITPQDDTEQKNS